MSQEKLFREKITKKRMIFVQTISNKLQNQAKKKSFLASLKTTELQK